MLKRNENRERCVETRTTGFIEKNYKAVGHKQIPKFRKTKLDNIHPTNNKWKFKFTDQEELTNTISEEEQKAIIEKAMNGGLQEEVIISKFILNITERTFLR